MPMRPKIEMVLSKVVQNSPAEKAGLQIGDKILKENLTALPWQDFIKQVEQGESFSIKVERNGETFDKVLTPVRNQNGKWFVGVSPALTKLADEYRTELKYGILESLQKALKKQDSFPFNLENIRKLLTGDLSLNNLSGPISIAKVLAHQQILDWCIFLSFMALISVNLGIMNLFPLPVLDGGHLVFFNNGSC